MLCHFLNNYSSCWANRIMAFRCQKEQVLININNTLYFNIQITKTVCSSNNAPDMYLGGEWFKSWQGH
jgi:hypothetical protein